MQSYRARGKGLICLLGTFEQLEERIVLDGAAEGASIETTDGPSVETAATKAAWSSFGDPGTAPEFVYDGNWHLLDNGKEYRFDGTYGLWRMAADNEFWHEYGTNNWWWGDGTGYHSFTATEHDLANFTASRQIRSGSFSVSYSYSGGYDYFHTTSDSYRVAYDPATGDWNWEGSVSAVWTDLGDSLDSVSSFYLDGQWHELEPNRWVQYLQASSEEIYWYYDNGGVIYYFMHDYNTGQWERDADGDWTTSDWVSFGDPNAAPEFVYDGNWHLLDNGKMYRFDGTYSLWQMAPDNEFWHEYGTNNWWWGDGTGYHSFTATEHDLANFTASRPVRSGSFSVSYSYSGGYDYFHTTSDSYRTAYDPATGDWNWEGSVSAVWTDLGDSLDSVSSFYLDGQWHELEPGRWIQYLQASSEEVYWYYDNGGVIYYFMYDYNTGQWERDADGDWTTSDWVSFGDPNAAPEFVYDGNTHVLGNGKEYRYDGTYGLWRMAPDNEFWHEYGTNNWWWGDGTGYHSFTATEHDLANFTASRQIRSGSFSVSYSYSGGYDYFHTTSDSYRTAYDPATGDWNWEGSVSAVWTDLGDSLDSVSSFYLDGQWHELEPGRWIQYLQASSEEVYWYYDNGGVIYYFMYDYNTGQWERDADGDWTTSDWVSFGDPIAAPEFVYDGNIHLLPNGKEYRFDGTYGLWRMAADNEFWHEYGTSNWWWGDGTAYHSFTATEHDLANFTASRQIRPGGFSVSYSYSGGYDYFHTASDSYRVAYDPATGHWNWESSVSSVWTDLGDSLDSVSSFYLDGQWHNMNADLEIRYSQASTEELEWRYDNGGTIYHFRYDYDTEQWQRYV